MDVGVLGALFFRAVILQGSKDQTFTSSWL